MTRRILALDPGPTRTGWVVYIEGDDDHPVEAAGVTDNEAMVDALRWWDHALKGDLDVVVVEQVEPHRGVLVGWATLDTARWVGRFEEAARPLLVARVNRSTVLQHLGVRRRRKGERPVNADSEVRRAMTLRFVSAVNPDALHGVSSHAWQALAVAVTWADQEGGS